MGYENGAGNTRIGVLFAETHKRTWLFIMAVLAAFILAMALAVVMRPSVAFADDAATGTGATAPSDEGGSVSDGDISLTPTESGELKSDESEPAEIISVTIISRDGQALQTFQIAKGKTISFVDGQGEVLVQYTAEDSAVVEPVAPTKSGYEFTGWSVSINAAGNAVITPLYNEAPTPTPAPDPSPSSSTTNDVKASRSANGTVTTSNSPKTGDMLTLAIPLAVAGIALVTIAALLFTRRRN